jgi:CBS domain containing-hemolysin-like protein
MAFFVLVLVMVNDIGKPLTLASLVVASVVSGIMVWMFTGVVAGGFARYAPAEAIAKCMTLLRLSYAALYPIVWLASVAEDLVRRGVRADSSHERQEEELLSSIEDTQRKGAIDDVSAAILENTLEFGDTTVGAVMTPRAAVKGLPYSDDLAAIRSFVERARYSRYPVYESSLDQVMGVLYVKDLVPFLGQVADGFQLRPLLRTPMRVPESKPVRDVLGEFQRSQVHFAVVVNEYGGVSGIVTIEDIIEELVGEISDEHERFAGPDLKRISDAVVEVRGRYSIYDLNEALNCELPEDEGFETVAGLMLARLGHIPKAGEKLESDGAEFEVLRATATTVEQVRVTRKPVENLEGE